MARYFGKAPEELDADFVYQTAELGLLSVFGMLASTEAALRVDFIERVSHKKKDEVSRSFCDVFKKRGRKVRLAEDILDVWKEQHIAGIKSAVSEFKGVLNLRHWLAHGQWWKPKLGRIAGYDEMNVFDICRALLQTIGLTP